LVDDDARLFVTSCVCVQDVERTKAALEEADFAAVLEANRRFLEGVHDV
jgi:hypothetical protein